MSIKNCIKGYKGFDQTNEKLAAAEIIMQQFQAIQEISPTSTLDGMDAIMDYIEATRKSGSKLTIESLIAESVPDWMSDEEEGEYNRAIDEYYATLEEERSQLPPYDGKTLSYPGGPTQDILFLGKTDREVWEAKEILGNVRLYDGVYKPSFREVLKAMQPVLAATNAMVKLISPDNLTSKKTFMQYDIGDNTIKMTRANLETYGTERTIQAFMHEVVHSVTIKAYIKPETAEEKKFRSLIDRMYAKYMKVSKFKREGGKEQVFEDKDYGFRNELEFIAEMMTNPLFQEQIRNLEEQSGKNNLWQQFLDAIRELFGLEKTSDYDTIIKAITEISVNNKYVGGITNEDMLNSNFIYESQEPFNAREHYDKSTVEGKLTKMLDKIKDNLEDSIRKYDTAIKKAKNPKDIQTNRDELKQILQDIELFADTQEWQAISIFISKLSSNLNNLKRKLNTQEFTDKNVNYVLEMYKNYLKANAIVSDLAEFIADAKTTNEEIPITKDELIFLQNQLTGAKGDYSQIADEIQSYTNKAIIARFNNRMFASEVIKRWETKLGKQFNELGYDKRKKKSWVANQINVVQKDAVDAEVLQHVTRIVENDTFDITRATYLFNSSINTNSKLIQMFQNLINQVREAIVSKSREQDLIFKELFDRWIAEKGNVKPSEMYKNILDMSEDTAYLKGEYSIEFKKKYEELSNAFQIEKQKIKDEEGIESAAYKNAYINSEWRAWIQENTTIEEDGEQRPIDKWKNDLSKLSPIEKEVLAKFQETIATSAKQTFGFNSLVTPPLLGASYTKLPAVTASTLELALEGKGASLVKDAWKDLTALRVDDVGYETTDEAAAKKRAGKKKGYEEKYTGIDGQPIYNIKVHFRGNIDIKQQSLDLFTIMRLEMKNGINYEEKHKEEVTLNSLLELAKSKTYYATTGVRMPIIGKFIKRNKRVPIVGQSYTYKKMAALMESNVYDILHKNAGKMGKIDGNKVVRALNGWTAGVGMAVNEVTAVTNVLNGKAQLFLEGIAGNFVAGKSLAKAEKIYFANIKETFQDVNNPIKTSFVNQLTDAYDVYGLISVSAKQAFLKNNLLKANVNMESLTFMQEGGEHWLQSVLTMGVLDTIKVMNVNNEFIDKNGNVVEEAKAASLLDMHSIKDGKLVISPLVIYTTKSIGVKYKEGGKEMINNLVKKKIFDTMGNYDSNMQPEAMRHALGKLIMMYRKYLIPMGVTRYRGFAFVDKKAEDLRPEQRFYSDALQEYEEGFYTSGARYLLTTIIPAIRKMEWSLMSKDWENLSEYEKKNIHKAVAELMLTMIILPIMLGLVGMMGDDDSKENSAFYYFVLLELRRLQSELAAYRDPREQYRIFSSPIPSVRMLQNGTALLSRLFTPWNWNEKYKAGERKDQFKFRREIEKITPILNSTNVSYKEKFEFIENITSN